MRRRTIKRNAKPLILENQTQKRREQAQELRSSRRQGVLLAKRRKSDPRASKEEPQAHEWSEEQLAAAIKGVRQSSLAKVLPYLTDLRKLLSLEDNPVEEVVEKAGLAPRLIELLSSPNDQIQIEAAW